MRAEAAFDELPDDDAEVTRRVEAELRRWTGTRAAFGFTKVHRFTTVTHDGDEAECRARTGEIVARADGLSIAR